MRPLSSILKGLSFALLLPLFLSGQGDSSLYYIKYPSGRPAWKCYIRNSDSALHGPAERYDLAGNLIASGYYRNNQQVGIWQFYQIEARPQIMVKYDFGKNQELEYQGQKPVRNQAEALRYTIKFQEAHFAGGAQHLSDRLQEEIRAANLYNLVKEPLELNIMYKVNADGSLGPYALVPKTYSKDSKKAYLPDFQVAPTEVEQALLAIFSSLGPWYPQIEKGKPVESDWLFLPLSFNLSKSQKSNPNAVGGNVPWGSNR